MPAVKKTLKTCPKGHQFYKSSSCPVCPICGKEGEEEYFIPGMVAPARRALENAGIASLKELAQRTEKDLLKLHGMGPASMPNLRKALASAGLSFNK